MLPIPPASRIISAARYAALALALGALSLPGQEGAVSPSHVSLIEADPHHPGTLLAGTAAGRLFRSRDDGSSWSPLPFPAESRSNLHALLIDPDRLDVYWVAVSSENPQFAGLFRSDDQGATWQPVPALERKQVWSLAFWNVDSHVISAGTEDGVYLTRNGGQDWKLLSSRVSSWPHPVVSLAFDPADVNIIYAGTPHLAWKTVDGGTSWHTIAKGMTEDSDIFSLNVDVSRRSRLFAGACSGIYRSLDGGVTWSVHKSTLGGPIRTYVIIGVPDRRDAVYAASSIGLMLSPDGGVTWYRLLAQTARYIALDPTDSHRIYVATDEGILRSDDGGLHFRGPGSDTEKH